MGKPPILLHTSARWAAFFVSFFFVFFRTRALHILARGGRVSSFRNRKGEKNPTMQDGGKGWERIPLSPKLSRAPASVEIPLGFERG